MEPMDPDLLEAVAAQTITDVLTAASSERTVNEERTFHYEPIDQDDTDWTPIADLLGTDSIPSGAADIIRQAIDQMCHTGLVSPDAPWQAIEFWAADYLAATP